MHKKGEWDNLPLASYWSYLGFTIYPDQSGSWFELLAAGEHAAELH